MARIDCDDLSFDDDAASDAEIEALAECLLREASELSAMYPPGRADRLRLDSLVTRPRQRSLRWGAGAAVAVLLLCVTSWIVVRTNPLPQANQPKPRHAVGATTVGMDDHSRTTAAWPQSPVPDVMPILPGNRVGAHDMNGPEIEAVLNLIEGNRSSLKLAL
jgi:hypothetical protein